MSDQTDPEPGPNLTLLKWIVGILGFLIVLFAGIIGVTIFMRLTATETDSLIDEPKMAQEAEINRGKGSDVAAFGDIRLPIPDDMDVISLSPGPERLFITLGTEGAARLILVIRLNDGKVLGSFNLEKDGIQ
ncbi:hypothetical protein [uncultured Sneathiella sp.]|jgi:hypothetical protein|uniref:hypothetical protein n=1 Tax=uncultured Sneathiella sp. TaxID=879315 RepID=UPI0030DA62D2|tara:strand:- start:12661 stop:13056 length:396 start_codon:yes stop_codon:yes gene_type:complete